MFWWNAAGHTCLLVIEMFKLLVTSVAVGVALLLWRTPGRSYSRHSTEETARYYLHLPRRTRIASTHACVLSSLVLLSTCPLSIAGSIAAGGYHTCALTASGGVRCWGQNTNGQASVVRACYLSLHVCNIAVMFDVCSLEMVQTRIETRHQQIC